MRCTNCGWENPEGAQRCEKCNSPLAGQPVYSPTPAQEPVDVKSTVREGQAPIAPKEDPNTCPECGFPIREGSVRCPNCGKEFFKQAADGAPFIAPPPMAGAASKYDSTVNPWSNPNSGKTFKLQPVAWDNEQGEIPAMNYAGEKVELRRENTDPANNTITSKTQAEITLENGKWFIEDKSAQHSTFVHAGRKMEIADGDVIVLGNRRFVFKV
ncbi:MAG: zinc ribbon domain-containing protein [Bacteroidales bacterium]|nr:zinc ribbon domain-containing protein [Bacteroidales bacterium]